jgi:hypothetical protein
MLPSDTRILLIITGERPSSCRGSLKAGTAGPVHVLEQFGANERLDGVSEVLLTTLVQGRALEFGLGSSFEPQPASILNRNAVAVVHMHAVSHLLVKLRA